MSLILPHIYVAAAFLVQFGLVGSVGTCDRGRRRGAPCAAIWQAIKGRLPKAPGTAIRRLGSFVCLRWITRVLRLRRFGFVRYRRRRRNAVASAPTSVHRRRRPVRSGPAAGVGASVPIASSRSRRPERVTKSFDASPPSAPIDPLASANAAVAWVVVANKPFYPFAVWWFVGAGFEASLAVLIATPFMPPCPFLPVAHLWRRGSRRRRSDWPTLYWGPRCSDRVLERNSFCSPAGCSPFSHSGRMRRGGPGA